MFHRLLLQKLIVSISYLKIYFPLEAFLEYILIEHENLCHGLTVSDWQVTNYKCMGLDTWKHLKLIILVSSAVRNSKKLV